MPNTVLLAPDLYSRNPVSAVPGARRDFRSISLATTDLITTQIIALGVLPAGHRLHDLNLETDSLDSDTTGAITVSVGILNSNYNAALNASPALISGKDAITASTVARAGGRAGMTATLTPTTDIGVDEANDRIIAVQFPAAPTTAQAGDLAISYEIDCN